MSYRSLASTALVALLCFGLPATRRGAHAEDAAAAGYSAAELKELVGQIALYPDVVIASLLPATTFPSDITAAAAYVAQQGGTVTAVPDGSTWDPSVQAMLQFPDVLAWLAQNGQWVAQMGYAVSTQSSDVMLAIQAFRKDCQAAGNLKSDEHQIVSTEDASDGDVEVIIIQPANPTVVYVPVYSPVAVVRPGYVWAWGIGFAMGASGVWGYHGLHWGAHGGEINISRNTNINTNVNVNRNNVNVGPDRPGKWNPPPAGQRPGGGVSRPNEGNWGKGTGTRPGAVTPPRPGSGSGATRPTPPATRPNPPATPALRPRPRRVRVRPTGSGARATAVRPVPRATGAVRA